MKAEHKNNFDTLLDIELNAGNAENVETDTSIFAELRFDSDELDADEYLIEVGVKRAHLELELWGCDIVPGTRLHDRPKATVIHEANQRRSTAAQAAAKGKLGGQAGSGGNRVEATGSVGGAVEGQLQKTRSSRTEWESQRVVCRPGKRWEILDHAEFDDSAYLSGTYIANERICNVTARQDANMIEIAATVTARRRDLVVKPEGGPIMGELRRRIHQEKFVKAVLAKAIVEKTNQSGRENQTGRFVLATSHLRSDDDVS